MQTLSVEEQQSLRNFKHEAEQERRLAGQGLRRELLGRYLSVEPRSLKFTRNSCGKPSLKGPDLYLLLNFNLTYAGNLILLAFAQNRRVGIDAEELQHIGIEELAAAHFTKNEIAAWIDVPNDERVPTFFRTWTRKEAIVKALGTGLITPLDSFEVGVQSGPQNTPPCQPTIVHTGNTQWRLQSFAIGETHVGAMAYEHAPCAVTFHHYKSLE